MELHDEQQALVIERLRAANGAPVSYEELRQMGVENPALLGYELAAVGLPVERQRTHRGTGALTLPVDLGSGGGAGSREAQPVAGAPRNGEELAARERTSAVAADRAPVQRRPGRGSVPPTPSILAGGLVLAVLAAVVAMALTLSGAQTKTPASVSHSGGRRSPSRSLASTGTPRRTRGSETSAVKPKATVAVSSAAAAALEAEGHQLLTSGRYGAAIGELRKAIEASGGSLASCSQPTTEACLTYAYALYDLGRALQLDGDSAAAVPVLNERLRIDNQRGVVEQELELARRAAA